MICVIPARGGSKGIPRKNMALVGSSPLLSYSVQTGKTFFDEVFVSTDDEDIKIMAVAMGAKFITRPAELATDSSTDFGWVAHAFDTLKCAEICIFRPTTPIRDENVIKNALEYYDTFRSECDSMRSAHLIDEPPNKFVVRDSFYWKAFTGKLEDLDRPRQSFAHVYKPNGYIDITKNSTIKNGSIYGNKILAFETPVSVEIDTREELDYLNYKLTQRQ